MRAIGPPLEKRTPFPDVPVGAGPNLWAGLPVNRQSPIYRTNIHSLELLSRTCPYKGKTKHIFCLVASLKVVFFRRWPGSAAHREYDCLAQRIGARTGLGHPKEFEFDFKKYRTNSIQTTSLSLYHFSTIFLICPICRRTATASRKRQSKRGAGYKSVGTALRHMAAARFGGQGGGAAGRFRVVPGAADGHGSRGAGAACAGARGQHQGLRVSIWKAA